MEDITKKGSLTYKELQQENDITITPEETEEIYKAHPELRVNRHGVAMAPPSIDELTPQEVYSPLNSKTDFWGNSRHDEKVTGATDFYLNLQDVRARNQSNFNKVVSGLAKGAVLAGTVMADGAAGILYGIPAMIVSGIRKEKDWYARFWDNEISNAMQDIQKWSEEVLPNYRTEAEENRTWIQNAFSPDGWANLWFDGFAKNMGYTVGALYSGKMWTGALRALGALKRSLPQQIFGSTLSAVNEARMEANNNSDEFETYETARLKDSRDELIKNDPANAATYNKLYEKQLEDLKVRKAKMGLMDMGTNIPLLIGSNFFTWRKLYSRGWSNARQNAKELGKQASRKDAKAATEQLIKNTEADEMAKHVTTSASGDYGWDPFKKLKAAGRGLARGAVEGNEEMAQAFLSEASGNLQSYDSPDAYYTALLDPKAQLETKDFLESITEAFANSYGDFARWEEGAAGFLTGVLGIPTFGKASNSSSETYIGRGKTFGVTGGIFGELASTRQRNNVGKEAVDYMNKYMSKQRDQQLSFAKSRYYTDAMDSWAKEGNAYEYKNNEDNDFWEAIHRFAKVGKLDDLKSIINQDFENFTDEQLAEIAAYDTISPDNTNRKAGWKGPDGKLLIEREDDGTLKPVSPENREYMKKELIKKRDDMLRHINNYADSMEMVESMPVSTKLSEDELNEIAWLNWRANRFRERFSQMRDENKGNYSSLKESIGERIKTLEEAINETVEKKDSSLQSLIAERKKDLKYYQNVYNLLDFASKAQTPKLKAEEEAEYQKATEALNNKTFYDALADESKLPYAEYQNTMKNLLDMVKIVRAHNAFEAKVKEYSENPSKLTSNREKIAKKIEGKKKAQEIIKKKEQRTQRTNEEMNQMSASALDDAFGEFDVEEVEAADPEVARVQTHREKAHVEEELTKEGGIIDSLNVAPEVKAAVTKAVHNARQSAESAEEMLDFDSEVYRNPEILDLSPEELAELDQEAIDKRIDEVREAMKQVVEEFDWDEMKATMNSLPDKVDTETGEIESVMESAASSSKDGQDQLPPINDGETFTDEDRQFIENLDIKKRAQKIIDDSAISLMPAMEKGIKDNLINLLSTLKVAQAKGISFDDIMNEISTSEKYKEVYNAVRNSIPNLHQDLRAFYNDISGIVTSVRGQNIAQEKPQAQPTTPTTATTPEVTTSTSTTPVQNIDPVTPTYSNITEETRDNILAANNQYQPTQSETQGKYRPSTTQYPIQHERDSNEKFWETITDPVKRARYKKVTEYLEKVGAYTRMNSGKIKPNMKVHFFIDKAFNETLDDAGNTSFTIFYTDVDGNILGNVADETSSTLANQGNLKQLIEAIKQEYAQKGSPDVFTSEKYSTTIDKTYVGYMPFVHSYTPLNKVFTAQKANGTTTSIPFTLGIAMEEGVDVNADVLAIPGRSRKNSGKDNIDIDTRMVKNVKPGTPVILIDAGWSIDPSNPTRNIPRRIAVPIFSDTFKPGVHVDPNDNLTTYGRALKYIVGQMRFKTSTSIMESVDALNDLLGFGRHIVTKPNGNSESKSSLYIEKNNDNIIIKAIKQEDEGYEILYSGDVHNVEGIIESFRGIPIQVSRKYVNGKYRIGTNEVSYNEMLGDIIKINLAPGDFALRNSFFTTAPVTNKSLPTATTTTVTTKPKNVLSYLTTAEEKAIWDNLPTEYQDVMKTFSKIKVQRVMAALRNQKTLDNATLDKIIKGKNRLADITKPTQPFNVKKELGWLAKNLPQFTEKERLTLVEGLIKVSNDANAAYAWGQFKNGVITLSRAAARGTTYHEAFHAVFDTLLSESEKEALYKEAEKLYGTSNRLTLEENLAERFREYVQYRETPKGKIKQFFEKIKHLIDKIRNKPMSIDSLYYRINNGSFAKTGSGDMAYYNSLIRQSRTERLKYNNLDNESKEYLAESNISEETYDKMTLEEKENLLYCKI